MDYNRAYKIGLIGVITGLFMVIIGLGYKIEFEYIGLIVVVGSAIFEANFTDAQNAISSLVFAEKGQDIVQDVVIS